jgi:hypothetical protein
MTVKSRNEIIGRAIGKLLAEERRRTEELIRQGPAAVNDRLFKSSIYRRGVEARDTIAGFCDAYRHSRAHVVKGNAPALVKRLLADDQ